MDKARFEKLTQEIVAQATVEQMLDLETRTARLLAERVSEADATAADDSVSAV